MSGAARQAASRLPRTVAAVAAPITNNSSRMNAAALAAAAVVAAGAYGWYLRGNVANADDGKPVPPKAFGGFPPLKRLTLQSAEMVNHNTKRLRFEFPDKDAVSGLGLTSATLTVSFPGGGWKPTPRPYTPVSDIDARGHIDFLIKHYPGGAASTHMHSLKPGDSVLFMPIPGYKWAPNKFSHISLVAGGAGITPMYQLTRGILTNPADHTNITLVWGVNEDQDLFLADEFAQLQREYPGRINTVYAISRASAGTPHHKGYVTGDLLKASGVEPGKTGQVLVCGPPPMENALIGKRGPMGDGGVLGKLGFTKGQVYKF